MQRRRFIQILAASVAGFNPARLTSAQPALETVTWQGYTLGAEGRLQLYTDNKASGQDTLRYCFTELQRLEKIFSLYDPHSELSRLNRDGRLDGPAPEWCALLNAANQAYQLSKGLFDPTVQPLWQLYAQHFKQHPHARTGPARSKIQAARTLTGWQHVHYDTDTIQFNRPGMQLTLNGIAQGFITDHISTCLKHAGYSQALIELGETRAIGAHPAARPWRIGIKHARQPATVYEIAELDNQALATSGGYGSRFSTDGQFHHLFHPRSGYPTTRWSSISVIAPTATQADALSTGLCFANAAEIQQIEQAHPELSILKQI